MQHALCPLCHAVGAVAERCDAPTCSRFGVHRVPAEYGSDASRAPDPLVGRMLGEYLIVRRLGAGGIGCVYLALQQPIGLPAAVKLIQAPSGPLTEPERFRQEAVALARLNHPNIVRLLKFGVEGDSSYLVMEYVEDGRTLADEIRRGLSVADAARVLQQLCHGLEAAHRRGVVHRDIKPANIMLQSVPGESHLVRVVDFGLAKFVDEGDSTQLAAGTPRYMAPEQGFKDGIGPWTDVYAVTVLACEMLLGHDPFPGSSPQSVLLRKCDPSFDPLASLPRPVGPAMMALLQGGLARSPADRLQDATTLAVAIAAACAELEAEAGPAESGVAVVEGPRRGRRRALAAGAAAVVAVMVAAMAWWSGSGGEASREWGAGEDGAGTSAVAPTLGVTVQAEVARGAGGVVGAGDRGEAEGAVDAAGAAPESGGVDAGGRMAALGEERTAEQAPTEVASGRSPAEEAAAELAAVERERPRSEARATEQPRVGGQRGGRSARAVTPPPRARTRVAEAPAAPRSASGEPGSSSGAAAPGEAGSGVEPAPTAAAERRVAPTRVDPTAATPGKAAEAPSRAVRAPTEAELDAAGAAFWR